MAKRSRKRVARYQRDRSGCMWGLISIFDFRHGRSQKLLQDKKRGSKRSDGAAYANITLESLTDVCEVCNDTNGSLHSETSASEIAKSSVKELMEEEMLVEDDKKMQGSVTNGEAQANSTGDDKGHVKKNRRWMKNKMSLDLDANGFVSAQDLVAERIRHRKHKSCSSIDLHVIVEELCNRIHKKDTSCVRHVQDCESTTQSIADASIIEKKLWESTKVLVNHYTDANDGTKDDKIQPSKELTEALQILNSNKDLFLKLLQDPSSELVKYIQSSQDIQVEEGKFKVLSGSGVLEQDIGNCKQHSFFWRRFKGLEKNSNSSRETNSTTDDISRIVLLKPGLPSSGVSDMETPCSSLPGSPRIKGDKDQIGRTFSLFSFSEFKRKLKHAIRKEQDGLSNQPSEEKPNLANQEKKIGAEQVGMVSPSRDHFFLERIPKASSNKAGKLKDDNALTPEQRVSNIYIEAKKHLAEIVGNSEIDGDNPSKRRPKSLGRILAYSGYTSPISSPRTEGEMKLSPKGESQTNDEKKTSQIMQASNLGDPNQVKQESESEPCIVADKFIHDVEVPFSEPQVSDGLRDESNFDKPIHETEFSTFEVPADSVRSSEAESQKECTFKQVSSESVTKIEQDVCEENEPSSSPNASTDSTLVSQVTENIEDLDTVSDATSRPSPISVLEPFFQDDDISPPGLKHSNELEPIQPRQIQFGQEISAPLAKVPSYRIYLDDEKYTIQFVKDVVRMAGLTWDELLRRSLLSEHLIDPSLLDEIDFLPDLLSCDFNALFDLISEVLVEICWINFGCLLSLAIPQVQPELKGKDIFAEIWKEVDWYIKLEGPPLTLDHIVAKDLAKTRDWMDLQLDCQNIGIQMQEFILEELVEDTILSCILGRLESDFSVLPTTETKENDIDVVVDVNVEEVNNFTTVIVIADTTGS